MVEQGTLWSESLIELDQTRSPAPQESTYLDYSPKVEHGPFVKVERIPFLLRSVSGNSFLTNPFRSSDALRFIDDPSRPRMRTRRNDYDSQLTAFSDLPPFLYPLLSSDESLTPDNITERLVEEIGSEGLRYAASSGKYLAKIPPLGEKLVSSSPYVINVNHFLRSLKLEGELKTDSFYLSGRFDEVRKGDGGVAIVRVSQEKQQGREPSINAAMRLGLDHLSFQAMSMQRKGVTIPRLLHFDLVDGKLYELRIAYNSFYLELIDALIYSGYSMKAGYTKEDTIDVFENNSGQNKPRTKIVTVYTRSGQEKLSAEQAHERSVNCKKRIAGKVYKVDKKYRFISLN
jgi:hypothetical protein